MEAWHNVLGMLGSILILLAYFLLQYRKIAATDLIYSSMNATGAFLLVVSLCFDFNLAAFVVEVAWVLISIYGIWRCWRTPQKVELS